jgi:hypothetical protein
MSDSSLPSDYYRQLAEANRCEQEGQYEAAFVCAMAAKAIAQRHRDEGEVFNSLVFALGVASALEDEDRKDALEMELLSACLEQDTPHTRWILANALCGHFKRKGRNVKRAEEQLRIMEGLISDIAPELQLGTKIEKAQFFADRGVWASAVAECERAWTWADSFMEDMYRDPLATIAYRASLRIGRVDDARRWVDTWRNASKHIADSRLCSLYGACEVETAAGRLDQARRLAAELDEEVQGVSRSLSVLADEMNARIALLDSKSGDPECRIHRAWRAAASRRWIDSDLVMDVRLAAVRWAAGIEPLNDSHWWLQAERCPAGIRVVEKDDLRRRIRKARKSIAFRRRGAHQIDSAFECNWRQQDLEERQRRLDEIVAAM